MINIKNFVLYTKNFGISTSLRVYYSNFILYRTSNNEKRKRLYELKHKAIEQYLWYNYKTYLTKYKINLAKQVLDHTKMPIWVCWLQGENNMPPIVKTCFKSIIKNANYHPVILITLENFQNFINLAPHIISKYEQGIIEHPFFSDIIRVNLLCKYGGIWIDSTYLMTSQIPDNLLNNSFFSIRIDNDDNFSASRYRWQISFISTNVIGFELFENLKCFFEEYTRKENQCIDYLTTNYAIDIQLQKIPFLSNQIDNIPFTNPDIHELRPLLSSEYDAEILKTMNKRTWAYKLTYKASLIPCKKLLEKASNGAVTFYGKLINDDSLPNE